MSGKFSNSGKNSFLASRPTASLDADDNNLASRCKFNFSYFEKQNEGKDFDELSAEELSHLFNKLKEFGMESLTYWKTQRVKGRQTVYVNYVGFPKNSRFTHPKYVPHQVEWGRFRIDRTTRLCGFTVPTSYHGRAKGKGDEYFCSNTFYVVFFDPDHKFYPGKNED